MQHIINTEKDLENIQGKFVIQINFTEPDKTLMDFNWAFVKEKRLKMVVGFGFVDLFGGQRDYESFDRFKKIFNQYLYKLEEENGGIGGERFHRLLTGKEIDYLAQKLKEENY